MIGHSLKNTFDSLGYAYDFLHFVKISGLLRFSKTYSGQSLSNTLRDTKFFGERKVSNQIGVRWVQI